MTSPSSLFRAFAAAALLVVWAAPAAAQRLVTTPETSETPQPVRAGSSATAGTAATPRASAPAQPPAERVPDGGITPPAGYVIGPDDVLDVVFWKDEESSTSNVPVRPDGKVSLTLLGEMHASGLTPEEFKAEVAKAAEKFLADPEVYVNIRQINSRRVFITGMVARPGAYPLGQPTTVLQLLSMAGGLQDWARAGDISIIRTGRDGQTASFRFNYNDVRRGRNLQQDIELMPGDRIIVP